MSDAVSKDALAWRKKFAVIVPATNTIVEPEFAAMRPPGVTNHTGRFTLANMPLNSDADFEAMIADVKRNLDSAVAQIVACEPDYVILGMSAETFWDGLGGSHDLKARLESIAGCPVGLGSEACEAALACYPGKKVGVITPYWPVGDRQVRRFFGEIGRDVVVLKGLKCRSPLDIAAQNAETLRDAIAEVNAAGPDVIVQVGTNLCMAELAGAAETELGKPVIAVNTAIYWHALRSNGIDDRIDGFGSLLRDH